MTPTPANDNHPHYAADFGDLAARRAWLSRLPNKAKPVLAWPTAERLSRLKSPSAAAALISYSELSQPARMIAANDNAPGVEIDVDMRHETRPSIDEMLRAVSDGMRARVVAAKESGQWKFIERHEVRYGVRGSRVELGNLTFASSTLVTFGQTDRGRGLRPVERSRAPRGFKPTARSAQSIRFLVANDDTPIANGAGWLGGITRPRGNGSRPDIGEAEAEMEMHRNARRDAVRLVLGPRHARVLDLAISDASAREIGEEFGHVGKTAERRAVSAINDALTALQEIAA